ncbi:hypothetical protein [Roseomonas chloroacetimidivorans]|uniref:hypothetical protein n=1 Tax=Roseomonas chloroacetimidivorans TaxID=1766656 RepID=UPI003C7321B9
MSEVENWTQPTPGTWKKRQPGRGGELELILRVWEDPTSPMVTWTWEVAEVSEDDGAEMEVDVGGAESREAAMEAASARAAAYLETGE